MNTTEKFLQPIFERNRQIEDFKLMNPYEKSIYLKDKYNLSHGKGKRKYKKKN